MSVCYHLLTQHLGSSPVSKFIASEARLFVIVRSVQYLNLEFSFLIGACIFILVISLFHFLFYCFLGPLLIKLKI